MTEANTTTFIVNGMTCGHCVLSVKEEVADVAGVTSVDVDLESGRMTVTSEGPVATSVISEAVSEAGYSLVDAGIDRPQQPR